MSPANPWTTHEVSELDLTARPFLRLFPTPSEVILDERMHEDLWDRTRDTHLSQRPRVIMNMVSSLDGKAVIGDKAGAIGGESDRRLMRVLRSRADAIMIGAGTLRAEKISLSIPEDLVQARVSRGLPEQPLHIILCNERVPKLENAINPIKNNIILIVGERADFERLRHSRPEVREVVRSPANSQGRVDLNIALSTLRKDRGVDLLLVEGGPSLEHSLLSSGLADELHLTLAPKLIGGDSEPPATIVSGSLLPGKENNHELLSIHASYEDAEQDLFLRYQLTNPAPKQSSFR